MIQQAKSTLLAIDPGTRYTGYAVFDFTPTRADLKACGLIKARASDAFDLRSMEINSKLRKHVLSEHEPTLCVIEMPEYQEGNRGQKASKQGNTLVLAFLVGNLCANWHYMMARNMREKSTMLPLPTLVKPTQWKGQLSKQITAKRCIDTYCVGWEKKIDDNKTDAVMLGDWWLRQHEVSKCGPAAFVKEEDF